ncbi:MAG: preprotein translocase subunit SecE [Deltaproteobacteria bacterium]|nr:preprotein translocase subunit SecE [Deltaproteobacteria bacterium]
MKISDAYDLEAKVKSIEFIIRGGSLLIGGWIFYFLQRNTKVNSFTNEVAVELFTKVTWPTSKETMSATGVVMVTVLLAGVVLAVFDWLWSLALRAII